MSTILITGCSGFLGQILTRRLLDLGFDCLGIDLQPCEILHPRLYRAYEYYRENRASIYSRQAVSAHRMPASMGVIRLLKWIS